MKTIQDLVEFLLSAQLPTETPLRVISSDASGDVCVGQSKPVVDFAIVEDEGRYLGIEVAE